MKGILVNPLSQTSSSKLPNLTLSPDLSLDLREHAIFTLRNLLENNPDNQAVVDGIKPTGKWDENGVLKDTLGSVRK